MRQNGLAAFAACAMCTSIAYPLSDFTKSPFQFVMQWSPFKLKTALGLRVQQRCIKRRRRV
jgi:hypothetical protein